MSSLSLQHSTDFAAAEYLGWLGLKHRVQNFIKFFLSDEFFSAELSEELYVLITLGVRADRLSGSPLDTFNASLYLNAQSRRTIFFRG